MPHVQRSSANRAKMQTKLSAWTPLNHPVANSKVFEERRSLLAKWFDSWSDGQRRAVLQDLVLSCSREQLRFLSVRVSRRLPLQAADFTCLLPRALSLYLFSFLDPRSLCRCAQVSWHWKSIVELDQLWMRRCLRLGWYISFSPTPLERGVWKRHYIQTVQDLRLTMLQTASPEQQPVIPDATTIDDRRDEKSLFTEDRLVSAAQRAGREKQPAALPPWRDSDRKPKDTLRFNYLDNLDPIEQALRGQTRSTATVCRRDTPKPDDGGKKTLSEANYKLRKARSLMLLSSSSRAQHPPPPPPPPHHHHQTQTRPPWASRRDDRPVTKETAESLLGRAQWDAGIRPGPVRSAVPRLSAEAQRAAQRSHRSTPSTPLFGAEPWWVPASPAQR